MFESRANCHYVVHVRVRVRVSVYIVLVPRMGSRNDIVKKGSDWLLKQVSLAGSRVSRVRSSAFGIYFYF